VRSEEGTIAAQPRSPAGGQISLLRQAMEQCSVSRHLQRRMFGRYVQDLCRVWLCSGSGCISAGIYSSSEHVWKRKCCPVPNRPGCLQCDNMAPIYCHFMQPPFSLCSLLLSFPRCRDKIIEQELWWLQGPRQLSTSSICSRWLQKRDV